MAEFKCRARSIRAAKASAKKIGGRVIDQTVKFISVDEDAFEFEELEANYKNKIVADVGDGRWVIIPKRAKWAEKALVNRAKEIF